VTELASEPRHLGPCACERCYAPYFEQLTRELFETDHFAIIMVARKSQITNIDNKVNKKILSTNLYQ
jgi:hypothetical protein